MREYKKARTNLQRLAIRNRNLCCERDDWPFATPNYCQRLTVERCSCFSPDLQVQNSTRLGAGTIGCRKGEDQQPWMAKFVAANDSTKGYLKKHQSQLKAGMMFGSSVDSPAPGAFSGKSIPIFP